jgi:hypothetical protein
MRAARVVMVLFVGTLATPVSGTAQQATTPQPYTQTQVRQLLEAGIATARIIERLKADCIAFRVDAAAAELRQAGADDALLTALRSVCYRAPRAGAAQPSANPQGFIRIDASELPPGWARRVNALAPTTNAEISMTAGWRNTVVITAPGWCPLTVEMSVQAGEQRTWKPELRPRSWVGSCDASETR